jgi:monoamine oxidase
MPTLFTALRAHVRTRNRRRFQHPTVPPPKTVVEESSTVGFPPELAKVELAKTEVARPSVPKKRKPSMNPRPHLSLLDRFDIVERSGPRPHVIVVGAGFAGLSAAYELKSVGYKVTVVESRKTVGGRVESRRDVVPGAVMEGGAELIGRNHLAWWSYSRMFHLTLQKIRESVNPSPVIVGGWLLSPSKAIQLFREMVRGARLINKAAKRVNAFQPWLTKGAGKLDRRSLVQGLSKIRMSHWSKEAFLEQLQTDNGIAAEKQSWLGNLAMIKGGGLHRFWTETETHRCKGGNQKLAFKFKAAIRNENIRFSKEVRCIEIGKQSVTVKFGRGQSLTADEVIVAVPPTIWRKRIRFRPRLPKAYNVQFGKNVKYLLNVQQNVWDPEAPDMSSDGPINLTWKGTSGGSGSRAGLVAFSGAGNALICRHWENRKHEYLKRLLPVYPRIKQRCRNGVFMDWPANKWTKGSYSFPKPGEVMRVGPLMREGFRDRVHFAGEHTCYAFTGYMEAALQSGLRVAEQIARRDRRIKQRKRRRMKRARSENPKS